MCICVLYEETLLYSPAHLCAHKRVYQPTMYQAKHFADAHFLKDNNFPLYIPFAFGFVVLLHQFLYRPFFVLYLLYSECLKLFYCFYVGCSNVDDLGQPAGQKHLKGNQIGNNQHHAAFAFPFSSFAVIIFFLLLLVVCKEKKTAHVNNSAAAFVVFVLNKGL